MRTALALRNRAPYWAFITHRVSGVALALFLPLHLYVLGLAIDGAARLDGFLKWTDMPLVKASETLLVLLLAAHMTGGLRLLALEFGPWSDAQRSRILLGAGVALTAAVLFLLNLV